MYVSGNMRLTGERISKGTCPFETRMFNPFLWYSTEYEIDWAISDGIGQEDSREFFSLEISFLFVCRNKKKNHWISYVNLKFDVQCKSYEF